MRHAPALIAIMLLLPLPAACSDDGGAAGPTADVVADPGGMDVAADPGPAEVTADPGGTDVTPDPGGTDVTPDPGGMDAASDPAGLDPGPGDPGAADPGADPGPPDVGVDPGPADAAQADADACPVTLWSLNDGGTLGDGVTSDGTVYAIALTAVPAGDVARVELHTAAVGGTVTATVALHADQSGEPAAAPLVSGTLTASTTPDWYGIDLPSPLPVTADAAPLWLVFTPGGDIALPQAQAGDPADFLWGFGFGEWITAAQQAPWMVRLVGCP